MLYVSRAPHPSILPSERQAVLMTVQMERDGEKITRKIYNALEKGLLRYVYSTKLGKGIMYKWCGVCAGYLPLDKFEVQHSEGVHKMEQCKECKNSKRRAQKYGEDYRIVSITGKPQISNIEIDVPEEILEKLVILNPKYKIVKTDYVEDEVQVDEEMVIGECDCETSVAQ